MKPPVANSSGSWKSLGIFTRYIQAQIEGRSAIWTYILHEQKKAVEMDRKTESSNISIKERRLGGVVGQIWTRR